MSVLPRKMIGSLMRTWAVLFLAARVIEAEVELENGAYRNLLVSFSPNIPGDDGVALLNSMKELLENTSTALHTALGIRINDVTFILPDTWDMSGLDPAPEVGTVPPTPSHVVVESVQESPFGTSPLASQFGGCGIPGSHITVPMDFLKSPQDFPKGKLLAREFLKYRYGVFDENGFSGDPIYPSYYTIPGNDEDIKVTECTDPEVEYIFKDLDGNNCSLNKDSVDTCHIHPGEMSAENVTSSLMYFHKDLPNADHVCGKIHSHNNLPPSKQNILCGEKSIWDVIMKSPDFKNEPAAVDYESPDYSYVKIEKPKVAVVFENTLLLKDQKDELTFALRRLAYELPLGSLLSLHSFDESISELRPLSELTDRGNVVPSVDFDAPATNICPLCMLEKRVDEFPDDAKQGLILLIVGSNSTTEDNSELVRKFKASQLCLMVVALIDPEATVAGYNDFLSQLDCQSLLEIPNSQEKMATFDALFQTMMATVPPTDTDSPNIVVTSGEMSKESLIRIPAHPTAAKFTVWLSRSITESNILCKTDSGPVSVAKQDSRSTVGIYSFDSVDNDVTCNLQFEQSLPVLTQVLMTSKPGQFFTESVWIHDPTPADSKEQMPIILYANIRLGAYPVSNARVTAKVTDPDGNVGEAFEMYDNGKGDPDITMDDGIYSRYFFQFTKEGDYQVTVEMKDNGRMAKALKNGEERCCGSRVKTQKQEEVPGFTRTSQVRFKAVSAKPEQGYPPSKVIDLSVSKYQPPTLLELKWTAPGGEVDTGKAQSYVLKSFSNRKDALEKFNLVGSVLNITQNPGHFGGMEIVAVPMDQLLLDNATTAHLALCAVGENGLTGDVSNVLTVVVPADTRTTGDYETTTDRNIGGKKSGAPNKTTIGIVVGVLGAVLVVSIIVYLVIYCLGRRKKTKTGAKRAENGRSNASGNIGLNSIPADAIVRHHNEVVKAKSEHRDPPIFKEENVDQSVTPEYSQVQKRAPELPATDPPKSPKRMTFV